MNAFRLIVTAGVFSLWTSPAIASSLTIGFNGTVNLSMGGLGLPNPSSYSGTITWDTANTTSVLVPFPGVPTPPLPPVGDITLYSPTSATFFLNGQDLTADIQFDTVTMTKSIIRVIDYVTVDELRFILSFGLLDLGGLYPLENFMIQYNLLPSAYGATEPIPQDLSFLTRTPNVQLLFRTDFGPQLGIADFQPNVFDPAAVPEPMSLTLIASGLATALVRRRRRRHAA